MVASNIDSEREAPSSDFRRSLRLLAKMVLGRIECGTREEKPLALVNKESKYGKRNVKKENAMEDELLQLQRKFRGTLAERKQNFWALGNPGPAKLMLILRNEYGNIKKNCKIFRASNIRRDKILGRRTAAVLHQRNTLTIATQSSMQEQQALESMLSDASLTVRKLTAAQDTENELSLKKRLGLERVAQMENKLEVANKQLDAVQHDNWRLRQKIDVLLKDRANFNASWYKAITSLTIGKKFLTDMVDQSTLAYDQRDKWCKKLRIAHEKGSVDMMMHMQEMRELQKSLHNDIRRHDFLAVKGTTRLMTNCERREEEELARRKEDAERTQLYYKNILKKIQDYTGSNSEETDVVIKNFQQQGHKNFSIFQKLLHVLAETTALKHDAADLKSKNASRTKWNKSQVAHERSTRMRLERHVLTVRAHNSELRDQVQANDEILEDIIGEIGEWFKELDCKSELLELKLGHKRPTSQTISTTINLMSDAVGMLKACVYHQERIKKIVQKDVIKKKKWIWPKPKPIYVVADIQPTILKPCPIESLIKAEPCSICRDNREESIIYSLIVTPMTDAEIYKVAEANVSEGLCQDLAHPALECRAPRTRNLLNKNSN